MPDQNNNYTAFRAAHEALVEEQFTALIKAGITISAPSEDQPTVDFSTLLSEMGISESEWAECDTLAERDARFSFLWELSEAISVAVEAANALELSLFGQVEDFGPRVVVPLQAFIRVLDGLVDQVPELFNLQKRNILAMVQTGFSDDVNTVNHSVEEQSEHIVIKLLRKIIFRWTDIVKGKPGFSDPSVRSLFLKAVDQAMSAEYVNANCFIDGNPPDLKTIRDGVRSKSTNVIWVVALIPIIERGWPPGLDQNKYHQLANLFGKYMGWVDDICDLPEDLEQGKWSDTLLEIYDFSRKYSLDRPAVTREELSELLKNNECRAHLVKTGVANQLAFFDKLAEIGADSTPIVKLIAQAI